MRRQSVLLATLLALSVGARAQAQFVSPLIDNVEARVTPEAMVARLMSFDRNHDGKVIREELPERMQTLIASGDVSRDDALDATEARKLASNPAPQIAVHGLHAGQYGFGDDEGFSTRLHIDGAIEDLRLAAVTRDEALAIAKTFREAVEAKASADLLAAMAQWLTEPQLTDFKAGVDRQLQGVPLTAGTDVFVFERLTQQLTERGLPIVAGRVFIGSNLERQLERFGLTPDQKGQAKAALEQFKATLRLTTDDRTVLLQQMRTLLSEQQRDDLRAALERRPIVKQGGAVVFRQGVSAVPSPAPAPPVFAVSDLVLRR